MTNHFLSILLLVLMLILVKSILYDNTKLPLGRLLRLKEYHKKKIEQFRTTYLPEQLNFFKLQRIVGFCSILFNLILTSGNKKTALDCFSGVTIKNDLTKSTQFGDCIVLLFELNNRTIYEIKKKQPGYTIKPNEDTIWDRYVKST